MRDLVRRAPYHELCRRTKQQPRPPKEARPPNRTARVEAVRRLERYFAAATCFAAPAAGNPSFARLSLPCCA